VNVGACSGVACALGELTRHRDSIWAAEVFLGAASAVKIPRCSSRAISSGPVSPPSGDAVAIFAQGLPVLLNSLFTSALAALPLPDVSVRQAAASWKSMPLDESARKVQRRNLVSEAGGKKLDSETLRIDNFIRLFGEAVVDLQTALRLFRPARLMVVRIASAVDERRATLLGFYL
jgi:hypothetical protein